MSDIWRSATEDEWRARAEAWVPGIARQVDTVTSADKAYLWMRNNNYYVPRKYVRDVWREVKEQENNLPIINRMDDNQLIPRSMHRNTWSNIRRNNRYVVEIRGQYTDTGEEAIRTIAIDSDKQLSIGEIYGQASEFARNYGVALAAEGFRMNIAHALHRYGKGWS